MDCKLFLLAITLFVPFFGKIGEQTALQNKKNMKRLTISRLADLNCKASAVSEAFNEKSIPYHLISTVNWADFSYCPEVKFRIAHNGNAVFLNFKVDENDIKAVADADNGKVWEDSCVEFFVSFDGEAYYNIECNCIGKILLGYGAPGKRNHLSPEEIAKIDRWSSLGDKPVSGKTGKWEVSYIIPKEVFAASNIKSFNGLKARANFYKCGDKLATPHYISWNPIDNIKPNFHLPKFFGELEFE